MFNYNFASLLSDTAIANSQWMDGQVNLGDHGNETLWKLVDENGIQVLVKHGYNPACAVNLGEFWNEVLEGGLSGLLCIEDSKERAQFMDFWLSREDKEISLCDIDLIWHFDEPEDQYLV
jgi:hypothetical protein